MFELSQNAGAASAVSQEDTNRRNKRVVVLGLGNILLRDEGVGSHVVARLQKQHLPGNVEVIDGGTAGPDALLSALDVDKLVVVDATKAGGKPGTLYKARFEGSRKSELKKVFGREKNAKISLHQLGLLDALAAAEKINAAPDEIVIVGVEPGRVDWGLELTEPVEKTVPGVVKKVLEELSTLDAGYSMPDARYENRVSRIKKRGENDIHTE